MNTKAVSYFKLLFEGEFFNKKADSRFHTMTLLSTRLFPYSVVSRASKRVKAEAVSEAVAGSASSSAAPRGLKQPRTKEGSAHFDGSRKNNFGRKNLKKTFFINTSKLTFRSHGTTFYGY